MAIAMSTATTTPMVAEFVHNKGREECARGAQSMRGRRGRLPHLAINGATEEELVVSRMEVQSCHKVCMSAIIGPSQPLHGILMHTALLYSSKPKPTQVNLTEVGLTQLKPSQLNTTLICATQTLRNSTQLSSAKSHFNQPFQPDLNSTCCNPTQQQNFDRVSSWVRRMKVKRLKLVSGFIQALSIQARSIQVVTCMHANNARLHARCILSHR